MEFKVGDRVRIKIGAVAMGFPHTNTMICYEGKEGVVCGKSKIAYGVKMECDPLHEWWWLKHAVEPVMESSIPKPTWRIIIEGDKNTSRAKYIEGKKIVKEASAKRYHKDKHDPAMAARALIGKMFPGAEKKEEPPKYFTGRVVCVECPKEIALTVGKVYEVKDGAMHSDRFLFCENGYMIIGITSVENLNSRVKEGVKFIEIKE